MKQYFRAYSGKFQEIGQNQKKILRKKFIKLRDFNEILENFEGLLRQQ